MPAISASAPGKVILFGEHAVVYGRPAIAVPVTQVKTTAVALANIRAPVGQVRIEAPDIALSAFLSEIPFNHPIARTVHLTLIALETPLPPAVTLRITSTIPIAAGLGSGAATSVAIIRALSAFLGHPMPDDQVNQIAYEVEKVYHGTPSGIDNTTVTYACPVYYIREHAMERLRVPKPFTLIIADTGIQSPTVDSVADVREAWTQDLTRYEAIFDRIGEIAVNSRQAIETGNVQQLGPWMDENHDLLKQIGVSSAQLDHLVLAARRSGALGVKLSGGGRGGNLIALVEPGSAPQIADTLRTAGAVRTLITVVTAAGAS